MVRGVLVRGCVAVVGLVVAGCGAFPGDAAHADAALHGVRDRVGFDMDCKDAQLMRLGDVSRLGQQMTSMTIGAVGCGKKATYYVECVSNWGNITCTAKMNTAQDVPRQQPGGVKPEPGGAGSQQVAE
ncbi:hypothetical protein [Chondromyces crocatus]|uniref:Lipoprotein n=1 Tax=Chondromyces crocatus TaxID=52 RepID=A0A0K1EED2_CHOCO|nr:hypothetical protein [Chondromyces crocatus]AKT39226.1 uncharacterized protein CMC5_033750 [Chondromyces crocatus]